MPESPAPLSAAPYSSAQVRELKARWKNAVEPPMYTTLNRLLATIDALDAEVAEYRIRNRLDKIVERHNNARGFSHFNNGYDCAACYQEYVLAGLIAEAIARDYIDERALARETKGEQG